MCSEPYATPTTEEIGRAWRSDRRLSAGTVIVYLDRIKRFRAYCAEQGLIERDELSLDRVDCFIRWYARRRHLEPRTLSLYRNALLSLNRVYRRMGLDPPPWRPPAAIKPAATPLLAEYADYLHRHRGNSPATVNKKLHHIGQLQAHLEALGKPWTSLHLADIDAFLISCATQCSRSYAGNVACSIRCFVRFLHGSGRLCADLSDAVIAPVRRRYERPQRALAWADVQRLLAAVDRSNPTGLRDYALLLLMSSYGLGAGEVIRLQGRDIDWQAATLSVVRPKTGTAFNLPLLPAVAKAVAQYLYEGRPPETPTRHLFVTMHTPFAPFASSSAIRHIIAKHARLAGIAAPRLGSHVLRHSFAARQLDLGMRPRVISELLGHRDAKSVSAYVRIATQTLREIALPVPL